MKAFSSAAPALSTPLPAGFSFLREWCKRRGKNYEKTLAAIQARERGESIRLAEVEAVTHDCKASALSASKAKTLGKRLASQGLPAPCPFCTCLSREAQVEALMSLLLEPILGIFAAAKEGGEA